MAWSEVRYATGTTPTDFTYTGQRSEMDGLGLMYYGARWYDPLLGRFVQPDSIVPLECQSVQAWDRYAYANNNPLSYSDPDGHRPLLLTAAIGAAIGFGANYTIQTVQHLNEGMTFSEAISISTIDKQELAVATVGGFVGGLTLGVASVAIGAVGFTEGITTASTALVGGAVSNVAAGQTEAITNAAIDQVTNTTTLTVIQEGQHMINFSPNLDRFLSDANKYGFGDQNTIIHDAVVGGVVGGVSAGFQGLLTDAGTPSALYLGKKPAS